MTSIDLTCAPIHKPPCLFTTFCKANPKCFIPTRTLCILRLQMQYDGHRFLTLDRPSEQAWDSFESGLHYFLTHTIMATSIVPSHLRTIHECSTARSSQQSIGMLIYQLA